MSAHQRPRLFLIDGMAIAYRSYFAFIQRPLVNSKGENTSAVYGFVSFLNKILDDERPDYIGVVFDTPEPTFRHRAYPAYKATRQKMPDDMASQLDVLKDVVRAYSIPVIEVHGYEADDVIGTLARRAAAEGLDAFLVTSDKDFMQLVSEHVLMYKPGRQGNDVEVIGPKDVEMRFGVTPDKVVDVLGLVGDSSDNVPGVKGVGEKSAIPLVQKYGSIEDILKHVTEIPQKGLREKLERDRESALLSKELVTIHTEVPVGTAWADLKAGARDTERLKELFARLEFTSLLRKISAAPQEPSPEQPAPPSPPAFAPLTDIRSTPHEYELIRTTAQLRDLVRTLKGSQRFAIDTETTSTDPMRADLLGLSFCARPGTAYYVPVRQLRTSAKRDLFDRPETHRDSSGSEPGLPLDEVVALLKPLLSDPSVGKVGQNLKYDMVVLARHGINLEGIAFDTMIASYILRADGQHNLDALAAEHLGYSTITYDQLTGTGKARIPLQEVPAEQVCEYACEDADITLRLATVLEEKLTAASMMELFRTLELPLVAVLARMELTGVALDVSSLQGMSKELERMLDNLRTDIHRLAGVEFNINSTQQLAEILFQRLKLPPVRKTKTGFSTDVGVLEELRQEHPIVEKLLEFRQLGKLKSTYVDALPDLIHPDTGRVHTSFNQTIAATGRLSSSDPNLQNIPIRTEIGRSIRTAFVAGGPDRRILSADYSQIELRIMAHVSGDEGLGDAFRAGEDIHATTAAKVFGVPVTDVPRDMRRKAKEINFGIMYGIGPFGLARRLDISQTEAKEIIDRYFERFPRVRAYITDTISTARRLGYVSTLLGRRRYLPEIASKNNAVRQNAERQAINMPIQGTAADMIKLAMVSIDRALRERKLRSSMILQVHDELVFEVWMEEAEKVRALVLQLMKNALPLSVPVEVETGLGKNWLESH